MVVSKEQALQSFGLSEKEQVIYLSSLELGSATANRISERAYVNRSTTYDTLKSLLEKGICSRFLKNGKNHFEVVSPKHLIHMLDEKKQKLSAVMPELEAIQESTVEKPAVELYEGRQGISLVLDSILEERRETLVYGPSKIFDLLSFSLLSYIRRRVEMRLPARVIQEKSKATFDLMKRSKGELRQVRYFENYTPSAATFISGDKVAIIRVTEREPIVVLIIDKHIASSQKEFFEKAWAFAKRGFPTVLRGR